MKRPLNIMQLLPALEEGGVERGTLEVAAHLVKRGHHSYVVSAGGRLVKRLEDEGSTHIDLPVGKKSPLTLLLSRQLQKLIYRYRIDIVHVRSRMPAWLVYCTLKKIPSAQRPRLISTVHGAYSVNFYSKIMLRSDRVIAVSAFIYDYIQQYYPATDLSKVTVIPRGTEAALYNHKYRPDARWLAAWKKTYPQLQDKYLVMLPGRITRWKGHDDFIDIFNILRKEQPDIHGVIVGDAYARHRSYLALLKEKIKKYRLDDAITFTGHRADIRELMCVADVVLSLTKKPEAFGRTALEALSLGTPVVAYDHGGVTEILSSLSAAGLVMPQSVSAAAEKIKQFQQQAPTIKENNFFTLKAMLEKTVALYEAG